MDKQTKSAIIAISIIIPLSSFAVLNSEQTILQESNIQKEKKTVITSFYPIYEFTKQIAKDKVDVILLIPFGIEPHDWEPTINDIQKMQGADLIIINGIGFEDWINDFELINSNVKIVDTSKNITINGNSDPHIWLNPVFAKIQVENISNSLIQMDPVNEKYYKKNTDVYINELSQLDKKITQELSECRKDFVTFHSAFSYFAIQYGLNQHTIINSNEPYDEPTSGTLENIINLAKDLETNVIFAEEAVDTRTSQVIADEINGKVLILSPLEIGDSTDYIVKMENNLSNLKEALCK